MNEKTAILDLDIGELFDSLGIDYLDSGKNISENCVGVCCPFCGDEVICRKGFTIFKNKLSKDKKCPKCGEIIQIICE